MKARIALASLSLLAFAPQAQAIGESLFQGAYDLIVSLMFLRIKDAIGIIVGSLTATPDLTQWPIMSGINQGFTLLGGFFMLALTFQGIKYIMSADSPAARANSKTAIQKIVLGMILVSSNGIIFNLGLDLSKALTNAFVEGMSADENALAKVIMLQTMSLACIIAPLGLLSILLLLFMFLARYMLIILLFAFFPLILALYFSQLTFLKRMGERGVSLYISVLVCGPVMAFIFKLSYDLLIASTNAASNGQAQVNAIEPLVALLMSLIGFALAGLSPLATLGLINNIAAVSSVLGGTVAAVAGGATAGTLGGVAGSAAAKLTTSSAATNSQAAGNIAGAGMGSGLKDSLKDAGRKSEESMRNAAVKVAATQEYNGSTPEGRMEFMKATLLEQYRGLQQDGTVTEDEAGRINVGDGGKYSAKGEAALRDYFESEAPHGRGFGDQKSRRIAEERGLLSNGKIVLKNAAQGGIDVGGGKYDIAVNDPGDGLYNVAVAGTSASGASINAVLTVPKTTDLSDKQQVIGRIMQLSQATGEAPNKVAEEMGEGKDIMKLGTGGFDCVKGKKSG